METAGKRFQVMFLCLLVGGCGHVRDDRVSDSAPNRDEPGVAPLEGQREGTRLNSLPVAEEQDAGIGIGTDATEDSGGEEEQLPPCLPGMAWIPPGDFLYGPSKSPVYLDGYCLDLVEVTVAEWNACVEDGGCDGMEEWEICLSRDPEFSPNQCFEDREDFPANYLNWRRAEAYCRWAGKRLPTSEEWEKGARGTDGRTFSWGEAELTCELAHQGRGPVFNLCMDAGGLPNRPVPNHLYGAGASPYGLLGTMGNVKEWIEFRDSVDEFPEKDTLGISRGGDYGLGEWGISTLTVDSLLSVELSSQGHGVRCASEEIRD